MYIDWVSGGTKTQCSLLSEVNQPTSTATPLKPLPKSQLSSSELAEWEIRLGHDYYLQSSSRKPKVANHILIFCHRLLWFVSVWHIMTCFLIIYLYLNIFYITWTDPTTKPTNQSSDSRPAQGLHLHLPLAAGRRNQSHGGAKRCRAVRERSSQPSPSPQRGVKTGALRVKTSNSVVITCCARWK